MNTKKYVGLGMIVLSGIGMEEGVRRAVNHWNAGQSAENAYFEALDQARDLANEKDVLYHKLYKAEGEVELCALISIDNTSLFSNEYLHYLCSDSTNEHGDIKWKIAQLQPRYDSAVQHSEQLQEKYNDDYNWFCGGVTMALFSLVLTASGLVYLRRKEEPADENKSEEKKE